MKLSKIERKQLLIYLAIAYGITFLMGIVMSFGYGSGRDVSVFPNAQMMYPAAGVMAAYLIAGEKGRPVPRRFFGSYLAATALMILCAAASGLSDSAIWPAACQIIIMAGSIACGIFLLSEKKELRSQYGLRWRNGKVSVLCILLFIGLYLLRTAISYTVSGQWQAMGEIAGNPMTWIVLGSILINFFLVFIAFFGEEYGWRYYLQPLLQRRFGKRAGVVILGVVWGLWHMPVNFLYYASPKDGLISMAAQQITCITLGIFFAYAYMKTQNIWVPVILHFLNNNLIPVITGTYSAEVIHNQTMSWASLLPALLLNGLIFGSFFLSRVFQKDPH